MIPNSPSTKWLTFFLHPPVGVFSLKGHRKFEAYLKLGPTVSTWVGGTVRDEEDEPKKAEENIE